MEIALNESVNIGVDQMGGLASFQIPQPNGASSQNKYQLDKGTAVQFDLGVDPITGMMWGRWQGGVIIQTDLVTLAAAQTRQTGSLHWFATPSSSEALILPLTGRVSYTWVGGTSPTDSAGTVGTLNNATLDANFTAQTVNVGLVVSMPTSPVAAAVTLNANALNMQILPGGNFKSFNPSVSCAGAGCAALTGSGVVGGQFSAPNGAGVGVGYVLNNGVQTVNGVATFRR